MVRSWETENPAWVQSKPWETFCWLKLPLKLMKTTFLYDTRKMKAPKCQCFSIKDDEFNNNSLSFS